PRRAAAGAGRDGCAAAPDGSDPEQRPVQSRPPDLCHARPQRYRAPVRPPLTAVSAGGGCRKQPLPDKLAGCEAAGAGEKTAAGVGDKLVEHVELRQLLKNLDKSGARVALIADKKQPGIVGHAALPRRPPLGDKADPIVIGIGPPQDLRTVV